MNTVLKNYSLPLAILLGLLPAQVILAADSPERRDPAASTGSEALGGDKPDMPANRRTRYGMGYEYRMQQRDSTIETPDKVERSERPEALTRPQHAPHGMRPEPVSRPERFERPQRPQRFERPGRPDRVERPDHPSRPELPSRPGR